MAEPEIRSQRGLPEEACVFDAFRPVHVRVVVCRGEVRYEVQPETPSRRNRSGLPDGEEEELK